MGTKRRRDLLHLLKRMNLTLLLLVLCATVVSGKRFSTRRGQRIGFGCWKGQCWSYCGDDLTKGDWCFSCGKYCGIMGRTPKPVACSHDVDCYGKYYYCATKCE